MTEKDTLKRSLGPWAIVGLGLGYMTPTVVFDTFGIVSEETNGVVPLAYIVALIVMLFTAVSYGKMVQVFPSAGSAYTYTRETMNPHLGFLVGWAALLDYLLLPMVNALIIRIYMESVFPDVPAWIWVVGYVIIVTGINVWSMGKTSSLNSILVTFEIVLIAAFIVLAFVKLYNGMGQGTILTTAPLFHANVEMTAVLTGATVVCFSFIGFDAITMYTEEAKNSKVMPKAIMLTVLIGGGIFFVAGYFAQALFPDVSNFNVTDDTLPEIGLYVGGTIFKMIFLAGAFAATTASGLASHASVSRLLYVMGRNGVLPRKVFGYVHPKFRTPVYSVIIVGVVSLLAISPSLELISAVINFGALIAFTFVNLSVIAYFVFRKKRYKTPKDFFSYVIMPVIGAGLTGVLWYFLHADALIAGLVWITIGFIYMLFLTKFFRTKMADFEMDEAEKSAAL
ncbi:amino acid permease [Virgibacillus dakarensis]|uniref:Amino acid permease-associated protein n=1 Tax=Lentibacillus populi TaxID=1827502 RepID=A0A9W5X544_9BACI|nr:MULTISPECIES: APC family permease [Bacillaceae]MBT2214571.1 APC family permease [Virgibacillus dakarensis]MTW87534.1 amino acid permease [Virgibacillus dakarensis]GGB40770.1 amino acid permease-associated protein [Lentibacillus populi]